MKSMNRIHCADCGMFANFRDTMPKPGGDARVHRVGLGCNKPTAEAVRAARVRKTLADIDAAFMAERKAEAAKVSVSARDARAGRINPLAAAFVAAGLAG